MATLAPLLLVAWTLTAVSAAAPSPSGAAASPSGAATGPSAAAASPAAGDAAAGQSPAPSASGGGLPGDPANGSTLYNSAGCTACHGAGLEGGIGPKLAPIEKLPDTQDPLNPDYLISTMPLPVLVRSMGDEAPPEVRRAAAGLRYVSVRCVHIGVGRERLTDKHWIYYPEDTVFHRIFVHGNG